MSKQRFNRFAWRDNVFADTDISAGLKCLAFAIAQFINCETGEANVGTRALAEVCGNSQTWVCNTLPLLAATGWLQVLRKGRRGSGLDCAGIYKMDRKREHTGCSLPDAQREHFSPPREHTGCSEPLNHIEGAPTALPSLVDRQKEEPRDNSAPDGADLRYLLHEAKEAYALSQTQAEPLRTIISDALSIMPRSFVVTHITASPSCQDFLASISAAKMELSAYSS